MITDRQLRLLMFVLACLVTLPVPMRSAPSSGLVVERVEPFWLNGGTYECRRATGAITIDGRLDEADWSRAPKISLVIAGDSKPSKTAVAARLLYDSNYLYFGAEIEDYDLYGENTGHDPSFGGDDLIELFVKPGGPLPRYWEPGYWEFHITPRGATRDCFWPRRYARLEKSARAANSGMKAAVRVFGTVNKWTDRDQGWTAEMAVPLSAFARLAPKPKPGDRWKFLVSRYDHSAYIEEGLEFSAGAQLSKANFHWYEDYPLMVFGQ